MKRIIPMLLCLVLMLTACTSGGKSGGENPTAAPDVGAATSESATEAAGAATGAASSESATEAAGAATGAASSDAATEAAGAATGDAVTDAGVAVGVRIPLSALDEGVLFIDCASGDTAMQILARVNASGEPGLAWNTCQTCAGSPAAFFALNGGQLVCQNCGNRFSLESVGAASTGGCMPWPLSGYVLEGEEILVPQSVIDEMAVAFRNWRKGL